MQSTRGGVKIQDDFNFSKCYSDPLITYFGDAKGRQACTTMNLSQGKTGLEARDLMKLLRTHRRGNPSDWSPDRGLTGSDICMHAGFGPVRINETTGSMVSELGTGESTPLVYGTAAPCTGIFKPVWFSAGLPDMGPIPSGKFDPGSLWWRHEQLHRQVILDHAYRLSLYQEERDQIENDFIAGAESISEASDSEKLAYSKACFEKAKYCYNKVVGNGKKCSYQERGVSRLSRDAEEIQRPGFVA